jgi:hypothetical protein
VMPIVYAAMAAAGAAYPASWRWITQTAMAGTLLVGWFWNPPYPFPFENNLAMMDFVSLQQQASSYLEAYAVDKRIASAWPFTNAVERPEFGYVRRPMRIKHVEDFHFENLVDLDRRTTDVLVVFSKTWPGSLAEYARYWGYRPQATSEQIRALGFVPVVRWTRGGQWIEICFPER